MEREREKEEGGRTLKAVNKMTLLFPLSYHVEKPIMVMLCMSVRMQQSLSLSLSPFSRAVKTRLR